MQLHNSWVGAGYFATLGIPQLEGREFTDRDTSDRRPVAVVSQSLAKRYFPGRNVIGQSLTYDDRNLEIVGVVGDVLGTDLRQPSVPMVYQPITQQPRFSVPATTLDVHLAVASGGADAAIRSAIHRVEPGLYVDTIRPLQQRIGRGSLRERLVAYLSWAFGSVALFLACVGLYGVLSYSVSGRTREIGVRAALGARPAVLRRMILRDAALLLVPGIVIGAVAARLAGQTIQALLFGVSATDPRVYAAVVATLTLVAVAAAFLPADRAATVDPICALRTP